MERADRAAPERPAGAAADDAGAGVAFAPVAAAPVSSLGSGDDDLHYSDGSHKWIAPRGRSQPVWEAIVLAHVEVHRALVGERPGRDYPADAPR